MFSDYKLARSAFGPHHYHPLPTLPGSRSEKFPERQGWRWACWPGGRGVVGADTAMSSLPASSLLPAQWAVIQLSGKAQKTRPAPCHGTRPDTGAGWEEAGVGEGGTMQLSTRSAGPPVPGRPTLRFCFPPDPLTTGRAPAQGPERVGRWKRMGELFCH